jgi:hypothetical protein
VDVDLRVMRAIIPQAARIGRPKFDLLSQERPATGKRLSAESAAGDFQPN